MNGFFEKLIKEAELESKLLPAGIEFHKRYGTDSVYEFYLNLSDDTVALNDVCGENVISGEQIDGTVFIDSKGYLVVKVAKKTV